MMPTSANNGAIAQLGERYNGIVEVCGSIPHSSTKYSSAIPKHQKTRSNAGFLFVAILKSSRVIHIHL